MPHEPERPRLDQDVYIYSDEDLSQITAEIYQRLREVPTIDESDAETASAMMYDLLTGDWQPDPKDP